MNEQKTLYEITGQESGIVIYGNKVIVCNWSNVCPDGGMPILSPFGSLMCWPSDEILEVVSEDRTEDIRAILPGTIDQTGDNEIEVNGMDIVSDEWDDLPALFGFKAGDADVLTDNAGKFLPTGGTVCKLNTADSGSVTVIAPDGWN